jgi:chloride channel protein, CIC family
MFKSLRKNILYFRFRFITPKNFLIIMAVMVGLASGIAAVLLKSLVHNVESLLPKHAPMLLYLGLPMIGILITVFLSKNVFHDVVGHGVGSVLHSISRKSGIIGRVKMYSRLITAGITVGFGGSTGLEAPIVVTGSAIGSNFTRWFRMDERKRILYIGCGTAGGIAAIFDAPVAGVLFALEVILPEFTISSFVPVLISGVTASFISKGIIGDYAAFSYPYTEDYSTSDVPFFILLGLVLGLIAVYFSRMTLFVESSLQKVGNVYTRAIVGGILLGGIIYLFPPLLGEGYLGIRNLLGGDAHTLLDNTLFIGVPGVQIWFGVFLLILALVKVIAMALTIGAGGAGGTFAPSMVVGGFSGFAFAYLFNQSGWFDTISTTNFTLIGMAGVLSGVMHAPLTGMFLIAEITDGYNLILPLMLVCVTAYIAKSYFEPYSLNTRDLILRGQFIRGDKDREVLSHLDIRTIIETDLKTIHPDASLRQLVEVISHSQRNIFPVVDDENHLLGVVLLNSVREVMFNHAEYDTIFVRDLMEEPLTVVHMQEDMETVMRKFEESKAWNLPVLENGVYAGFVSKSNIFSLYRKELISVGKDMTA